MSDLHDDSDNLANEEVLVETPNGGYVTVRLVDAIRSVGRALIRLQHGIDPGEAIKLSVDLEDRAIVTALVEHPDDPQLLSIFDDECGTPMSMGVDDQYGPS